MKNDLTLAINDILFEKDIEDIIFMDEYQWDEYISESRMISSRIKPDMSIDDISKVCVDVFDENFLPNHQPSDFIEISKLIMELL